jgi:hypothetical protein
VGYSTGAIQTACYATGAVHGGNTVGGLAGFASAAISDSYATGHTHATGVNIGGLIGYASSTVATSYATGEVIGVNAVGGLIGYKGGGAVTSCYAITGTVTGSGSNIGGLIGNNNTATLTSCYATGAVTGTDYTGGLAGYSSGAITNCYAKTGAVSGTSYVGGLCGLASATLTNCYSAGAVSGTGTNIGGLVGDGATVTLCYWDTTTSGQATSDGGTGFATAYMIYNYGQTSPWPPNKSTYPFYGWNFTTPWDHDFANVNGGYPVLVPGGGPVIAKIVKQTATVGSAFTKSNTATKDTGTTLTWTISNAPTWLSINSGTGALTGTPTYPGMWKLVKVTATDDATAPKSHSRWFTIEAKAADGKYYGRYKKQE